MKLDDTLDEVMLQQKTTQALDRMADDIKAALESGKIDLARQKLEWFFGAEQLALHQGLLERQATRWEEMQIAVSEHIRKAQ